MFTGAMTRDPGYSERYYERKADQTCTKCGVAAVDGVQLCARHLTAHQRADRTSKARLRADRRRQGLCADGCGRKSATYRCQVCHPRRRPGVDPGVYPGANPAARWHTEGQRRPVTRQWVTETDGRRRRRFRGQGRRGAPSAQATDEWDLRSIDGSLERVRVAISAYYSDENQALPRIQRSAPRREALGQAELAARFLDEFIDRLRKGLK